MGAFNSWISFFMVKEESPIVVSSLLGFFITFIFIGIGLIIGWFSSFSSFIESVIVEIMIASLFMGILLFLGKKSLFSGKDIYKFKSNLNYFCQDFEIKNYFKY